MNILCNNKKASFRYNLIKKMEAGMVLDGWEVKSIKSGHGQISESYISIRDDEIFLINSHFKILQNSTDPDKLNSTRKRKLLLKKREIDLLKIEVKQNGSSIIPLKIYTKKSILKIEIAIAKGKKLKDKRDTIKNREWSRNKERILKNKSNS